MVRTKNIVPASLLENIIYSGALDCFNKTKKSMIENYPSILSKNQYAFINQLELLETSYNVEEYPYGYLLEKEKAVLGLNIKYNFMFRYQDLYRNPELQKIIDIKKDSYAKVLGVIKKIKEVKMMAFCTIYDDSDSADITLFPRQYEKNKLISVGQVYAINGKVEKRKNQLQIVVDNMQLI